MANIIPFRGLRYNTKKIPDLKAVTTPPYDVISPEEQDAFYALHPNNIIRLELNKILDSDTPDNNRYTRSAAFLKEWIDEQILVFEENPAVYLYEEVFTLKNGETKSFKGFMTLVELEEFSKKVVLPHEETLSKAKADRFDLMDATHANFSHIYCLYMDPEKTLTRLIQEIAEKAPDVSFVAGDGVKQNLWVVTAPEVIAQVQKGFADKQLFIADGHHRYETALNFRNKMREENPGWKPADLFNYVMMMLVEMDDPGLVVFPTHRMVKDLEQFSEEDTLRKLQEKFEVRSVSVSTNGNIAETIEKELASLVDKKAFGFYTGGSSFHVLVLKDETAMKQAVAGKSDAYLDLDVSVLHTLILNDIFGIDMENMANQKNLVYTKQAEEAVSGVQSGAFQCSFLLNPTKIHQIKDVSLANEKMPQKSTYFYPKILTGLVMNKF